MSSVDPSFARPSSQLNMTPLQDSEVAVAPSPGKGFAINDKGEVPTGVNAGQWTWEFVPVTLDFGNLAAHAGTTNNVTIPGLALDDLCFWVGTDTASNGINYWTEPVCVTAETIVVHRFNSDTAAVDPASTSHYFLVVHRFVTQ